MGRCAEVVVINRMQVNASNVFFFIEEFFQKEVQTYINYEYTRAAPQLRDCPNQMLINIKGYFFAIFCSSKSNTIDAGQSPASKENFFLP